MQILTLQAKIGLLTKFDENQANNYILGLRAPSRSSPGTTLGTMDSWNCQILIQILTLHATTKFEVSRAKKLHFVPLGPPWGPLGAPPGPHLLGSSVITIQ